VFFLLTTFLVFAYYGNAGLIGYGSVSHWLSGVSAFVLFPMISAIFWPRSEKP
jgi:Na+/proline symporter